MEINTFSISLAACPVLLLAAVAFLILIAIGVREGDLGDPPSPAGSRIDAITRRVTGRAISRSLTGVMRLRGGTGSWANGVKLRPDRCKIACVARGDSVQ